MYQDQWRLWQMFGDVNRIIYTQGQDGNVLRHSMNDLQTEEYEFWMSVGGYYGNRAIEQQAFAQLLSVLGGLPEVRAEYDNREFARIIADLFPTVVSSQRLLKRPMAAPEGFLRDPIDENWKMLIGQQVEVLEGDRHAEHISAHVVVLDHGMTPIESRKNIMKHIETHRAFLSRDQQALGALGGKTAQANRFNTEMPQVSPDMMAAAQMQATGLAGQTLGAANNFAPNQTPGPTQGPMQ
jgi:hypothetical protein